MATATTQAYVESAMHLYDQRDNTYLAIGRTSAWENEELPPLPEEEIEHLDELVGFKRMDRISLCKPLREGETTNLPTVDYRGTTWALVPRDQAQEEEAHWVFYEARIRGTVLPPSEYRQVGVYINVPSTNDTVSIEQGRQGLLYFYDNRLRFNRSEDVTATERFILNMKGNE